MIAIFFRGENEIWREVLPDNTRTWRVPYRSPFNWSNPPNIFDPVTIWQEVFERNLGFKCPCCGCAVFNSKNFMEAPEWVELRQPGPIESLRTGAWVAS